MRNKKARGVGKEEWLDDNKEFTCSYCKMCAETLDEERKDILKEIYPVWIKGINVEQDNLIVADEVEYINNHLMFYWKKNLVFKVWLKKDYKNIKKALKDVGIKIGR